MINNVSPGQVFYIRCQAAGADASGYGAYGLLVNFGGPATVTVAPNTAVAQQADQGAGVSSMSVATQPTWLARLQDSLGATIALNAESDGSNPVAAVSGLLRKISIGTVTGFGDSLMTMALASHAHDHRPPDHASQHGREALAPVEVHTPGTIEHGKDRKAAGEHQVHRPQGRRGFNGLRHP